MEADTLISSSQPENLGVLFHPFAIDIIVQLIIVLILLIATAFFNGAERVYLSFSETEKQKLKPVGNRDSRILKIVENPAKLISTIFVLNAFLIAGIIVLSTALLFQLVPSEKLNVIDFIVLGALVFLFIVLFKEIFSGVISSKNKQRIAGIMSFPVKLAESIFYPLTVLFIKTDKLVKHKLQKYDVSFSMNEISQVLKLTSDQEISEEKEILEGIAKFGYKNVSEIMRPRVDVVSLDIKTGFLSVLNLIVDSGFSRIPVYSGSFDNIKGILYIKDILPHSHKGDSFKWQSLIRPPFYVPETKKINSLLKEFQKNKVHLAVVIDEYGGSSGIVTLEDVLEEIVGEIVDEFDEEEHYFSKIAENSFLFDGKTLLGDFLKISKCDETSLNDAKGDADTLAGLILELKGEIPPLFDKIEYNRFTFTIEAVDDRRIKQIKVEIDRNYQESSK